MDVLQKLGPALGFATLAGLNLYLTVFVTGLAIHYHWIDLSTAFPDLQVLGHPAVLTVAGILYAIEFFADKVPWLDSAWDALHTVVRPVGGAFLALHALGPQHDQVVNVVTALLAGGVTLTTHGAKAGTRLLVNGSPEPFSNIAVSVGEDAAVAGGLGVMAYSFHHSPYLSLGVFGTVVATLLYVTPKVFRFARIRVWLLWKKLSWPAFDAKTTLPTAELPPDPDLLFARLNPTSEPVAWVVPCLTGSSKGGLPTGFRGHLVALRTRPDELHFVGRRGWRKLARTMDLAGCRVSHESRFLSEDLILIDAEKNTRQVFVFDRSKAALVGNLTASLVSRTPVLASRPVDPSPEHTPAEASVE